MDLRYGIILYSLYFFSCSMAQNQLEIETQLKAKIFKSYDKKIRPYELVNVWLKFSLLKITEIDEVKEVMRSSAYLFAEWFDERLAWTSNQNESAKILFVPINQLWIPDFYILNTADSTGFIKPNENSLAILSSDGYIIWNIDLLGLKFSNLFCNLASLFIRDRLFL